MTHRTDDMQATIQVLREALEAIAEPDILLDANEEAQAALKRLAALEENPRPTRKPARTMKTTDGVDFYCERCGEPMSRHDAMAHCNRPATPSELWTCPDCAFTFAAEHENTDGSGYSCPACAEAALTAERDALRAVVRLWHDCFVKNGSPFINLPDTDMAEWDDAGWADSGWTPAEASAIRAALRDDGETA